MVKRIAKQMTDYMESMNSNESILVISPDLSPDARRRFEELSGNRKIHIVHGVSKDEIKPQIQKAFFSI